MKPPEEVRVALVRQWVASARDDLAWAEMGAVEIARRVAPVIEAAITRRLGVPPPGDPTASPS